MKYIRHIYTGIISTMVAFAIVALASPSPVIALTQAERRHYANIGILFIDDPCDNTAGDGTVLQGNDNIEKAFRFFISKGLQDYQAAGILGNLIQESNVNPASNNTAANSSSVNPSSIIPGVTERGGGIAQWEDYRGTPTRWTGPSGLLNYVAGKGDFTSPQGDGKDWKNLTYQLNFMWGELSHEFKSNKQAGLDELKKAKNVAEATENFENAYERSNPAYTNMPNRIKQANNVLTTAREKNWVATTGKGTPAASQCGSASGGAGRVNTDGYAFPLAPQTKKEYGGVPCNAREQNYTDDYGNSARIKTCHHDGSPAFDLMDGNGGSAVYALTKGRIDNANRCYSMPGSGPCIPGCMSIQFQAQNGGDQYYYWMGHLMQVSVKTDQEGIEAGQQIAQTATRKQFNSRCWGGGPHLHIDRGCLVRGRPHTGGNSGCRDPAFLDDLKKIWDGLPAE
jgi:hypothetical protein